MKKSICLLLAVLCLIGMAGIVSAEKGFETLYGLYCTEDVFGEPVATYDYEPAGEDGENTEEVKVCFALFLFDTENDMTTVILIGANEQNEQKYDMWITDYEPGATIMTFLLSQFDTLKETCEPAVDFCISFSFDGGENMTDIDNAESAAEFLASAGIIQEAGAQ